MLCPFDVGKWIEGDADSEIGIVWIPVSTGIAENSGIHRYVRRYVRVTMIARLGHGNSDDAFPSGIYAHSSQFNNTVWIVGRSWNMLPCQVSHTSGHGNSNSGTILLPHTPYLTCPMCPTWSCTLSLWREIVTEQWRWEDYARRGGQRNQNQNSRQAIRSSTHTRQHTVRKRLAIWTELEFDMPSQLVGECARANVIQNVSVYLGCTREWTGKKAYRLNRTDTSWPWGR